jgi:hypothetical protein
VEKKTQELVKSLESVAEIAQFGALFIAAGGVVGATQIKATALQTMVILYSLVAGGAVYLLGMLIKALAHGLELLGAQVPAKVEDEDEDEAE